MARNNALNEGQNLGTDNTVLGVGAGNALASGGTDNTCVGDDAGLLISTGDNNTCVGSGAGAAITTVADNTMIGKDAGLLNTAAGNTFIGARAGSSLTTGLKNTLIGVDAGAAMTTTNTNDNNVYIGYNAGLVSNGARESVIIGSTAGDAITTGDDNVIIGYNACGAGTTSDSVVLIGAYAGVTANIGEACVGIGLFALDNATGAYNVGVGGTAGNAITSGTYNTCLGYGSDALNTGNYQIALGAGATCTASNQMVVGSDAKSVTDYYFGEGVTNATALAITFQPTGGVGTDKVGGAFNVAGGKGTGAGEGRVINFQTSDVLGTGTTLQTLTTKATIDVLGNLCIGVTSGGATAAKCLTLSNAATAPTSSVDRVQLYAYDISAGNATLGIFTETAVVTETVVSDTTLAIKVNGTAYKICLKA